MALAAVSFLTDVSSEMIYPLLPVFLTTVLGANASFIGAIEGAAETTAALLKLASGWWSDRVRKRKPLVRLGLRDRVGDAPARRHRDESAAQVLLIRVADRVGKGIRNAPRDALIAESVRPEHPRTRVRLSSRGGPRGRRARPADRVRGADVSHRRAAHGVLAGRDSRRCCRCSSSCSRVREIPRGAAVAGRGRRPTSRQPLGARFWRVLGVIFVFTLGNSTDAFLLLRANQLGVPVALAPILWAALHVVKSASSTPGGALSDRIGRRPTLIMGWMLYAAVYFGFARASLPWHAWALFGVYGVFFGLTEGSERALIADLVGLERRGTAFGWYNLAIGLGALPASLMFGFVWDHAGAGDGVRDGRVARARGGDRLLAVAAGGQQQRLPGRS